MPSRPSFPKKKKLSACKHASSTSCIQQPADIGRQFSLVKLKSKNTTKTHLPSGYGLKEWLEDKFDSLQARGILKLKPPSRVTIVDHVICCPDIYEKAMHPDVTSKGFKECRMIDEKLLNYPDFFR